MFASVLDQVSASIDELHDADLTAEGSRDLLLALAALEVQANRLAAAGRHLLAELDGRGVAGEVGSRSTADVLAQATRLSRREAAARVRAARTFAPRRALTGEMLQPVVALVGAAMDAGTVSLAHGTVIADLLDELPGDVEAEHGVAAQTFLLAQAAHVDPPTLAKIAVRLRDTLDQDGAEDRLAQVRRQRSFLLIANPDGSATARGLLTPAAATALTTALDPLAAPRASQLGEADGRTFGQRQHDALLDLVMIGLKSGALPRCGGVATTIQVTVTAEQFTSGRGVTTGAYGDLLPLRELARLAAEAEVVPVVLSDLGGIVAYGRSQRLAPPALRRALAARDKGCVMPGCIQPPSRCEAHHIREWSAGGRTDADNLALLCDYDHDTFSARGWQITMRDGVPWCVPPPWIDPEQTPLRNTAHDAPLTPIPEPT